MFSGFDEIRFKLQPLLVVITVNFLIAEFFFSRAYSKNAPAKFKNAELIISLAGEMRQCQRGMETWQCVVARSNLTRVANWIHARAKYKDAKFIISRAGQIAAPPLRNIKLRQLKKWLYGEIIGKL